MSGRGTLAGAIGNTVDWFDFPVYGSFAKEIGEAFFPADVPSLQLLRAFAVFAVGYLMRPVGGLLLGPIGDLVGRRGEAALALAGAPGLIFQGATRTSDPERAVGLPPGAAVIV